MPAGYSSTPLAKKLGIKSGFRVKLVNEPDYYWSLFSDVPGDIIRVNEAMKPIDFIHLFTKKQDELVVLIPQLRQELAPNGIIWVSWPKKSSRVAADISENQVRDIALRNGLVDIKVCAVDEVWSGLKLVIPVKDRFVIQ